MFRRNQIDAYSDITNRVELADTADGAVRRIARDLHRAAEQRTGERGFRRIRADPAMPGVIGCSPVAWRSRTMRSARCKPTTIRWSSATTPTNAFDAFGPAVAIAAGERLVVAQPGQDILRMSYQDAASNRAGTDDDRGLHVQDRLVAVALLASPQARFQIVATPVSYHRSGGRATGAALGVWFRAAHRLTSPAWHILPPCWLTT